MNIHVLLSEYNKKFEFINYDFIKNHKAYFEISMQKNHDKSKDYSTLADLMNEKNVSIYHSDY